MTSDQICFDEKAESTLYTLIFSKDAQNNSETEWFEWIALSRKEDDVEDIRKRVVFKNFEGASFSNMLTFFYTNNIDREQIVIAFCKKSDKDEKAIVKKFGTFESALTFMISFRNVYRYFVLYSFDDRPIIDALISTIKDPIDISKSRRCYGFIERMGRLQTYVPARDFITNEILKGLEYPKSERFSKK